MSLPSVEVFEAPGVLEPPQVERPYEEIADGAMGVTRLAFFAIVPIAMVETSTSVAPALGFSP
jgi:hypothetical protein